MAQERTAKTQTPDSKLTDGKVRPKSKVQVLFTNSKHHTKPYHVTMVHPALAEKLVAQGKAKLFDGELTDAQLKANADAVIGKAKGEEKVLEKAILGELEDLDGPRPITTKTGVVNKK